MKEGILYIISGPSGCGKGTICNQLFNQLTDIEKSISVTTRKPRKTEQEGKNYYFRSLEEFNELIKKDMLLEWAEFCGNFYGTPKEYVNIKLQEGKNVLLEIEVQGALKVKEKFPEAVLIFLMPPSMEQLRKRIEDRKTETEEVIQIRMKKAAEEIKMTEKYDYVVINDALDMAVDDVKSIIRSEHLKSLRYQK